MNCFVHDCVLFYTAMKNAILFILLIISQAAVFSQNSIQFNKLYDDLGHWEGGFGLVQTTNGALFLVKKAGATYADNQVLLFDLDTEGEVRQLHRICEDSTDLCYLSRPGIRYSHDGHLLMAMSYKHLDSTHYDAQLMKLKSDGQALWTRRYGGTANEDIHSFMLTPDGGYALCGFSNSFGANGFYLCKTDGEGNMQWQRSYPAPGWPTAYSIDRTHDGGYMLVGKGGSIGGAKIIVIKTDSLGNQEWMRIPGGTGNNDGQHRGKVLADGNILVVGALGGAGYAGGFMVKLNPQGQVLWQRTYPQPLTSRFTTSIIELDNGDFVVGGGRYMPSSTGSSDRHAWLCRFNPQGQMQWQRTYYTIEGRSNYFYEISPAADGGYYGYGFASADLPSPQDAWLVKTDSEGYTCEGVGCVSIAVDVPEPGPQGQAGISCAPNPVSDHLRVYYALPAGVSGTQVRVVLRDMAGRELMSAPQLHPHSEGYAEFQVAALPAGVYVAQVEVAGRLSAAAKVVKR